MDKRTKTSVVAFLRAVNVGGTGKLPMADLRRIAGSNGWANPRTYLASGNLLGEVELADSEWASAEAGLERAIAEALSLDTAVMIRTRRQLVEVAARAPFRAPVEQCHVGFFKAAPQVDGLAAADATGDATGDATEAIARLRTLVAPDEFVLSGSEVFLRYPAGQARTKLTTAALARVCGSLLTVRGIRTVTGILERC